jgi:hypothetical protein
VGARDLMEFKHNPPLLSLFFLFLFFFLFSNCMLDFFLLFPSCITIFYLIVRNMMRIALARRMKRELLVTEVYV